jgi:hypothetical protein
MDPNPYQSPQQPPAVPPPVDPQWRVFAPRRRRRFIATDRPTAVTVICVLQLVLIPLQMIVLVATDSVALIIAGIQQVGLSPGIVLSTVLACWGLGMFSAMGMLSGAKWGWWAGAFFYAYSILRTFAGLVHLGLLAQRHFLDSQVLAINVLWLVVRIPVMLLILILFFSDDFLAYFERSQERKYRAATGIVIAAVLVQAAEIGVLWLMRTTSA